MLSGLAIETRPERLLPPASSNEQKLDRGVCPLCFVRLAECLERSIAKGKAATRQREAADAIIATFFRERLVQRCRREGCESPGAWSPRVLIRGKHGVEPFSAYVDLAICDGHRAWFVETSHPLLSRVIATAASGYPADPLLSTITMDRVSDRPAGH